MKPKNAGWLGVYLAVLALFATTVYMIIDFDSVRLWLVDINRQMYARPQGIRFGLYVFAGAQAIWLIWVGVSMIRAKNRP